LLIKILFVADLGQERLCITEWLALYKYLITIITIDNIKQH